MTREQKLALILGFALVLVVGILVSDHLSGARRADLANNVSPDDGLTNQPPLPMPREGNTLVLVGEATEDPLDERASPTGPAGTGTPEGDGQGVRLAQGGDASSSRIEDLIRQFGSELEGIKPATATTQIDPTTGLPVDPPSSNESAQPETSPTPAPVKTHVVQPRETMWKIAQQHYGNGKYHEQLAAYNSGVVGRNGAVSADAELKIPTLDVLLGRTDGGSESSRAADQAGGSNPEQKPAAQPTKPEPKPEAKPEAKPAKAKTRSYTVKKNDTLGTIAQKQLGTIKRMNEILELNKGLIDDADDIRVGMVLKLPAKP